MKEDNLTPCKAIRKFCIECSGSQKAPKTCENQDCPLWRFRNGKNPRRTGIGGGRLKRQRKVIIGSQVGEIKPLEFNIEGKKLVKITIEDLEEK